MKRIAVISDTHSSLPVEVENFISKCDVVFHAGDIGRVELLDELRNKCATYAVYGNIDDAVVRAECSEFVDVTIEGVRFLMTHIGGYPRHYMPRVEKKIKELTPRVFISGHSHILKVMNDMDYKLLHLNPGAAGHYGFHRVRTALRFVVDEGDIRDMEVGEWPR